MESSIEAVDNDIVLNFNKFLLEEGENEISVSQNFMYAFYDIFGS